VAHKAATWIILLALVGTACGTMSPAPSASASASKSSAGPTPAINPANFVAKVDNPWFPLVPGTTLTYAGTKDGKPAIDVFVVTSQTKTIQGVKCVVISDTLRLGGKLAEKTTDWYAQDRQGNVWYFGEATSEYDANGHVTSHEGSWQAGVHGAQPGIFMPANPRIGQSGRQEYYAGHAEDRFVVLLLSAAVKVRYGSFKSALLTAEWTLLEPDVLSEKYYVKGVGTVKEIDVAGGNEGLALVSVKKP
jgi:hypothetical protein